MIVFTVIYFTSLKDFKAHTIPLRIKKKLT